MLLNHPSFRLFDELYQRFHVVSTVRLRLQFLQSLRGVELRCQQDFVGVVDFANPFLAETAALEPDRIQAVGVSIAGSRSLGKGKNIAGDGRPAADKGVRANANEVVHGTDGPYLRPFLDRDVATESRRIRKDDVVADRAIMGDVGVSHNQDVTSHAGQPAAFYGAAIDGNELANLVMVANFKAGRFAGVGHILRRHSDRAKWKELAVGANLRVSLDRHLRDQMANFSQFHFWPDHTVGTNLATRMDFGARINDGGRVDFHGRSRTDAVLRCAPAASLVHELASHNGLGHALVAHVSDTFHTHGDAASRWVPRLHFNFEPQLVTGNHGAPEASLLDARKHHQLVAAVFHFGEQQRAPCLGDGLNDKHARHNGLIGKVSGKKRFIDSDVLDRDNALPARKVKYAVDQQERKTVWQDALDVINIQRSLGRRGSFGCRMSSVGHSVSR